MKQKLTAGAELDLLTREELATTLEQLVSGYTRPTSPKRDEDGALTPASGDMTISLPPVTRGMEVIYNRVVIESPGSTTITPATPYTVAGGYVALLRDQELLDFVSLVAGAGGGIPFKWTWSTSYGLRFRDGEALSALVHVPPAQGTPLVLRADGYMSPIAVGDKPGQLLLPGS